MPRWREIYEQRLTTADNAVRCIQSGNTVNVPIFPPPAVLAALYTRKDELHDVQLRLNAPATDPGWFKSESTGAFPIEFEIFIGDFARHAHREQRGPYLPNLFSTAFKAFDERRSGVRHANVAIVTCSPPNEAGFVHFGPHHWTKRSLVRRVDISIAEVDPTTIQVHGDVYAHVSEITHFVEQQDHEITAEQIEAVLAQMPEERRDPMRKLVARLPQDRLRLVFPILSVLEHGALERFLGLAEPPDSHRAIAGYLSEVIEDGDCIQIGVGEPSSQMVRLGAFDRKRDLGMHTELIAPGTARLVQEGIINGRRKNQFPGKVVAAAWTGGTASDFAIIHDNPTFQLFDPEYILAVPLIAANERQVSINSAISVDLIGQINSESIFGPLMVNGTGGQPETHIGAFLSRGGKAITVLPSTAVEGSVSRIVAMQAEGSIITVPRYYADFVITEYGVARLLGKNHRQRADELIAIAHPDHRAELRDAARRMF